MTKLAEVAGNYDALLGKVDFLEKRVAELETWKDEVLSGMGEVYPVKKLPRGYLPVSLRLTEGRERELNNLIEHAYVKVIGDGHLEWVGDNDTDLAFVCGRLWSGDRYVKGEWKKGKDAFPAAALERVFGKKHLKQKREKIFIRDLTDIESFILDKMR